MDRIVALRNVEEALTDFEQGDIDLEAMEARVQGVLRTYATEFEDGDLSAYRATGDPAAAGIVVVAAGPEAARERVRELADVPEATVDVEPVN